MRKITSHSSVRCQGSPVRQAKQAAQVATSVAGVDHFLDAETLDCAPDRGLCGKTFGQLLPQLRPLRRRSRFNFGSEGCLDAALKRHVAPTSAGPGQPYARVVPVPGRLAAEAEGATNLNGVDRNLCLLDSLERKRRELEGPCPF